ncbi:MAG: DUF933 domain-containing protein [bacterium]
MEIQIVGSRFSGKSTLFKALTGQSGAKAVAKVPDKRLNRLAEIYSSKKITPAQIILNDSPPPRANQNDELFIEKQIVPALKGKDTILYCLRSFTSQLATDPPDPTEELQLLETYLVMSDLHTTEKRLEKLNDRRIKHSQQERNEVNIICEKIMPILESSKPLRNQLDDESIKVALRIGLVSQLPAVAAVNEDDHYHNLIDQKLCDQWGIKAFPLNAELQSEISELPPEEQENFCEQFGLKQRAIDKLILALYDELSLITFLTGGEKEARAWPLAKGSTALQAAGKIHSDIQRGFIKAKVIGFKQLDQAGSIAEAKHQNLFRMEGKNYPISEGDVIEFMFNI